MNRRALDISGLCASYGNEPVLRDLSLYTSRGEILGVIGSNGSGKSTLLRSVLGLVRVHFTRLTVMGESVSDPNPVLLRKLGVIYLPQESALFPNISVERNIQLIHRSLSPSIIKVVKREVELIGGIDKIDLGAKAGYLSHGQSRFVALMTLFESGAPLFLLDEPLSGMSDSVRSAVIGKIRKLQVNGQSLVLVEQDLQSIAKVCSRVALIEGGTVGTTFERKDFKDDFRTLTISKR